MPDCLAPSLILDYLRGNLDEADRRRVESHLETCAICHDALVEREIEEVLPPEGPPEASTPREDPGSERRVGPYRLLRELGRGGQARVYLAEDTRLRRRVALKLFQPGFAASSSTLLRFRREAEALSRLDHPGVGTVYETGEWEGSPYIAMRYLEGETLAARIAAAAEAERRGEASDPRAVMRAVHLVEKAARALHAAHEAGLVHRDVKPSNVMITADGEPVVIDFGLARDEESAERSLTRTGDLAGTPAYMSPEQVRGERDSLDRRSDVFSLGVTLFEALTRSLPFDAPTTAGVFQKILAGQWTDPGRSGRSLPRDLRIVLATALDPDRARRYQTALAFAEDLRRFRERQTILARPAGHGLRLRRWIQRNPVIAVSLLAVFLILTTALGISLALLERIRSESAVRAESLRREEALRLALQSSAILRENPGQALLLAVEAARRNPSLAARNALMGALQASSERARLLGHDWGLNQGSFSADGSRIVTASQDRTARVWEAASGRPLAVLRGHQEGVSTAEFSPDGKRILTAGGDDTARIWEASSGEEIHRMSGHGGGPALARFAPDGSRVLTAGGASARLWDAASGRLLHVLDGHTGTVRAARFSPDGSCVLTGSSDGTAIIWDAASGKVRVRLAGHRKRVLDAEWSGDGRTIITASEDDGGAAVWDAESGAAIASLVGHRFSIYSAALSRDGEVAATGSEDFTARIWEARTGKERSVLPHDHKVFHLQLSPDGRSLLTASYDRMARLWDLSSGKLLRSYRGHAAPLVHAAFSPDGASIVTSSTDFTGRVWSLHPSWPLDALPPHEGAAVLSSLDPSGAHGAMVLGSRRDRVEVFAASTGERRAALEGHAAPITSLTFRPDGRAILTTSEDATARLWSVETGGLLREMRGHGGPVRRGRFSADGRRVATASEDGTVRLWDAGASGEPAVIPIAESSGFLCALSPDGTRLVTGASPSGIAIVDAASGRPLRRLLPGSVVLSAEWSPDGRSLAAATHTHRVEVLDAESGEGRGALVHPSRCTSAVYSPDGNWIATLCQDWTTRIWDAGTREELLGLRTEGVWTEAIAFVSAGTRIAAHDWQMGDRLGTRSRLHVYPLDPLSEALRWHSGPLTPDERDQFQVGSPEERAAHRASWSGGTTFGTPRD